MPAVIRKLMVIEFVCDAVECDRECLEFALKGDIRYKEKFLHFLHQVLENHPDRELFVELLKEKDIII